MSVFPSTQVDKFKELFLSKKKTKQTLWITAVQPEEINGNKVVPTVLCVGGEEPLIGFDALNAKKIGEVVNENFKIDLGDVVPGKPKNRKEFKVNSGRAETAYSLSKTYLDKVLYQVEQRFPTLEETNPKFPAKVIVAEPLNFQEEGDGKKWIKNYRENIGRILSRYAEVEFLPEPFAVYQYYRYGLRIPHLQDNSKQVAFIIDFGGGTFDACVIESTAKGDVSMSGKTAKPRSADSIPIGGFYVNKAIAKYLIKRDLEPGLRSEADRHIKQYERVLTGKQEVTDLSDRCQAFIENFEKLGAVAENAKIELTSKVTNWDLKSECYDNVIVSVPSNPFLTETWVNKEFYGHQLRTLFIERVWNAHLRNIVKRVLDSAKSQLGTKDITITLISGGSSNIRWLEKLISRDFKKFLEAAEPVPISHSFQEVVANGLAIECARRYYSKESEFLAVTYNPIRLYLDADNSGLRKDHAFRSVEDIVDMSSAELGDLVPSAQSLKHFFDRTLRWKVNLGRPPRSHLEYFFSRPNSDGETDSYNVEETKLSTKDSKHFDSQVVVEINVKKDGTVHPRFVYKSGNDKLGIAENSEHGRPFYIDMTSDGEIEQQQDHYVGLDFGTSNSSVCVLSQDQIDLTEQRQQSELWMGLSEAVNDLPYPVSIALRKFLSANGDEENAHAARETFEACLAFMAYVAAAEAAGTGHLQRLMKNFQHRSMGPLKALLEGSLDALGSTGRFSNGFRELFVNHKDELSWAITKFNDHKHDKLDATIINWQVDLEMIVRILLKAMKEFQFGYCSTSQQSAFENTYKGLFISAHDCPPFIHSFQYSASQNISSSLALLRHSETGDTLCLTPFIFWHSAGEGDNPHCCYWLDKRDKDTPIVKLVHKRESKKAGELEDSLEAVINNLYVHGQIFVEGMNIQLVEG